LATRLLVFDLDGTLVDSSGDIASALNAALARVVPGTRPLPEEAVRADVGEGARLLVERSLRRAGLRAPVDEVLGVYIECYRQGLLERTHLYPGTGEALATLAGRATLAVLTNKPGDLSRAILEGLGVASRFARIWGAGDVEERKPEPGGLRRLLDELEAGPGETWMIGDSATDVKTGRAAGVRVAGVTWGFQPEALRAAGPDRLLDTPAELPSLCPP
jgi:phosphoglycolate phosphatase